MNASLSLSLPHSDLCFVDSDSDGEWSGTSKRRRERGAASTSRARSSTEGEEKKNAKPRQENQKDIQERLKHMQFAAAKGIAILFKTTACDITMKLLWLSVFHSAASRPTEWFEYSTFLAPVVVPTYSLLTQKKKTSDMPQQVPAFAEFLEGCRTPAMISIVYRFLRMVMMNRLGGRAPGRHITLTQIPPQAEGIRDSVASMNPSIRDLHRMALDRPNASAAEHAEMYRSVVYLFKCTLDLHALESSRRFSARFDDSEAELMRYLICCNILEARSEEDVEAVFESASRRLQNSLIWTHGFDFVAERAIKQHWSELVCWTQRLESGHPVLLIRLGLAIRTCEGDKADEYGRAIITQIDRGVRKLLKNSGIDTLVALIDCEGASASNFNRFLSLIRSVPVELNKHYPGRLKSLHLVRVPAFVLWIIPLVKRFLHPRTRHKVSVCGDDLSHISSELREIVHWGEDPAPLTAGSSQSDVSSTREAPSGEIVPATNTTSSSAASTSSVRDMNDEQLQQQSFALEKTIIRNIILFIFFWIVILNMWSVFPDVDSF